MNWVCTGCCFVRTHVCACLCWCVCVCVHEVLRASPNIHLAGKTGIGLVSG